MVFNNNVKHIRGINNLFDTGAARVEQKVVRWISDLMGYPQSSAGNLTSGASTATLIGLMAARDAIIPNPADYKR